MIKRNYVSLFVALLILLELINPASLYAGLFQTIKRLPYRLSGFPLSLTVRQ